MGKMKKVLSSLVTEVQPSKSFIFTHRKGNSEASDAKNNLNRRRGDMHHLRCGNLLWLIPCAKGCDTSAGFDFKRVSEVVCEGGGNRDW